MTAFAKNAITCAQTEQGLLSLVMGSNIKWSLYIHWKWQAGEKTILIPFSHQQHQNRCLLMSGGNVCFSSKRGLLIQLEGSEPHYHVGFHLALCSLQPTGRVTSCPGLPGIEDFPACGIFRAKTGPDGYPLYSPEAALQLVPSVSLFSKALCIPQICPCPHPAHLEL